MTRSRQRLSSIKQSLSSSTSPADIGGGGGGVEMSMEKGGVGRREGEGVQLATTCDWH